MRLGLRGRIALLVFVALAPLTIAAVITELAERRDGREQATQEVLDSAKVVRADVKRVIEGTAGFLAPLATDLARHPGRHSCDRLLGLVPRSTNRYSSIGIAARDGTVTCGATRTGVIRPGEAPNVGRTQWFTAAIGAGRFVLGDYAIDPLAGTSALVAAQPLPTGPRRSKMVMFAGIDTRTLGEAASFHEPARNTTVILFDRSGTILARVPPLAGAVGRKLPNQPLVRTVLDRGQGTAELTGLDGVARIQGFAPVTGVGGAEMYVAASRPSSVVYAHPNEGLKRFISLGVIGLVLALLLSYLATKLLLERWTSGVVESARRFGAGDLSARAPVPRGFAELTDVANALNIAAEEIERRQREQARLIAELVAVEEETRRRIAADIHDDTAQAVSAAGLRLDGLIAELTDPAAREVALKARHTLGEANLRLRRLLFELRPPALDEAGLAPALELFLADSFHHDGFDWRVDNQLDFEPSPESRAVLYRVALEALTNVRKHAHAHSVDVLLERRGAGVAVRVRDDGQGFEVSSQEVAPDAGHIGLVSMRERAEAAGGRFALSSSPGGGTTVDFWMPDGNG
ncbi:MAG TPA: ATP-binding protein, partial [Thermoleophilaceae bacterium]|nr:ATP-binding protein [Thermoleophilaceae bacterium]